MTLAGPVIKKTTKGGGFNLPPLNFFSKSILIRNFPKFFPLFYTKNKTLHLYGAGQTSSYIPNVRRN